MAIRHLFHKKNEQLAYKSIPAWSRKIILRVIEQIITHSLVPCQEVTTKLLEHKDLGLEKDNLAVSNQTIDLNRGNSNIPLI